MNEAYLNFPFRLSPEGGVAVADADRHIRQRLEQILFTSRGERVMLPEFGCGVRDLIFAGNNQVLAAATEFTVARALQQHLGGEIMVNAVDVVNEDEKLFIHIVYTKTRDLQQEKVVFQVQPLDRVTGGSTPAPDPRASFGVAPPKGGSGG